MEKAWNAEIVNDKGFKKDLPPKLSIPQQVDNMKEKGIKFEIMSEADVNCTQENGHEILTHGPVRRTRI